MPITIKGQEPLNISAVGGGVTSVAALLGIGPPGADGSNVLPTDEAIAAAIDDDGSDTYAALLATAVPLAFGLVPDSMSDQSAVLQAAIDATPAGQSCLLRRGKYRFNTQLLINRSIEFAGLGATRPQNDNSNPDNSGVQLIWTGAGDEAILVQPPNAVNSRINPILRRFQVIDGGIEFDGRLLAGTAIDDFVIEDVTVADAPGVGWYFHGDVYEGRVTGMRSTDCVSHGIVVENAGEIIWSDIHTLDNGGDGMKFDTNLGTHTIVGHSSSRNAGAALNVDSTLVEANGVQYESNEGAAVVIFDGVAWSSISGNVAYKTAYAGDGVLITGGSTFVRIDMAFFGTTSGYDISAASGGNIRVGNYLQSAPGKLLLSNDATSGSGQRFHGAHITRATNLSIPENTWTSVTWDAEVFDTAAFHSTVTNAERLTCGNAMRGFFRLTSAVLWGSDGSTSKPRLMRVRKNGTVVAYFGGDSGEAGNNPSTAISSPVVYLDEGDYLDVQVYQTTGGSGAKDIIAGDIYSYASLERLGSLQ